MPFTTKMLTEKWTPDAVAGLAKKHELFDPTIIPATMPYRRLLQPSLCFLGARDERKQHKLVRRFIPKGSSIGNVSENQILRIQHWMNNYSRKNLVYAT